MPGNHADRAIAIEVRGLSKSFRVDTGSPDTLKERIVHPFRAATHRELEVLRDISFSVRRGEFFGIVGRNGSGKSTLLKLLASIYRPDRGRIRLRGRVSPLIELGVGFHPEMSARDNVITNGLMLGLTPSEARKRFDEVIEFAELEDFVDMKLKNYSSGMRVRLAFAVAIQIDPEILLLDEVLAVGDPPFAQRCQETFEDLKRRGRTTVVLVTHAVPNVVRHCDRAMMLEAGGIELQGSPRQVGARYNGLRAAPHRQLEHRAPAYVVGLGAIDVGGAWTDSVEVQTGRPLTLRVIVGADQPIDSARLRLWLTTGTGAPIFAPPLISLGDDAKLLGRGENVYVSIKIENRLAPGRYDANAVVVCEEGDLQRSSEMFSSPFSVVSNGGPLSGVEKLAYQVDTRVARRKAEQ